MSTLDIPARLQIMAKLVEVPEGVAWMALVDGLLLTYGNLASHIRVLEREGYIETAKTGSGRASRTMVAVTGEGRRMLFSYAREKSEFFTNILRKESLYDKTGKIRTSVHG